MHRARLSPHAGLIAALTLTLLVLASIPAGAAPETGKQAAASTTPLPRWQEPDAYSVDLVVTSEGRKMVMSRFIDHGRTRTEMDAEGHKFVMIELGDEKGTMLTLMPQEKRAIRQSRAAMAELAKGQLEKAELEPQADAGPKPEDLGEETLEGRKLRKLRFSTGEGTALGWFDPTTGAPVRMESTGDQKAVLEWRNLKIGAQPAASFEVPKGYELIDMDEMMSKMRGMGGPGGLAGVPGVPGGGLQGMAGNYAGGMAQNFGQGMGGSLGASLGGALGGPLGAVAGQYIGGRIGGMIGRKAAGAVLPGN